MKDTVRKHYFSNHHHQNQFSGSLAALVQQKIKIFSFQILISGDFIV